MNTDQKHQSVWPKLNYSDWSETATALHLWSQIVGKIRLSLMPWFNHSWHVPLYVDARGLNSSVIHHRNQSFSMRFDFVDHVLSMTVADEREHRVELKSMSVAAFYRSLMEGHEQLGLGVEIYTTPSEIADATPFEEDHQLRQYDADAAHDLFLVLLHCDRVLTQFRAGFLGKCSPVQFFWGSFDMAVTRFSGRTAPPHPGGIPNFPDWVARESYSHEVSSAGFWPGNDDQDAVFYSYAYPAPEGFAEAAVKPEAAYYHNELGEFVLPYDAVRQAADPDQMLLDFLQSSYEAAADLADWDRERLEFDLEKAKRL